VKSLVFALDSLGFWTVIAVLSVVVCLVVLVVAAVGMALALLAVGEAVFWLPARLTARRQRRAG
jgi:hypothetical protein